MSKSIDAASEKSPKSLKRRLMESASGALATTLFVAGCATSAETSQETAPTPPDTTQSTIDTTQSTTETTTQPAAAETVDNEALLDTLRNTPTREWSFEGVNTEILTNPEATPEELEAQVVAFFKANNPGIDYNYSNQQADVLPMAQSMGSAYSLMLEINVDYSNPDNKNIAKNIAKVIALNSEVLDKINETLDIDYDFWHPDDSLWQDEPYSLEDKQSGTYGYDFMHPAAHSSYVIRGNIFGFIMSGKDMESRPQTIAVEIVRLNSTEEYFPLRVSDYSTSTDPSAEIMLDDGADPVKASEAVEAVAEQRGWK